MESRTLNVGDVLINGRNVYTITRVTDTRAYAGTSPVFYRKGIDGSKGIGFREYGTRYWSMYSLAYRAKPGDLERIAAKDAHYENVGKLANEIVFTNWRELSREKLLKVKAILEEPE